jgi:hypothetical protein
LIEHTEPVQKRHLQVEQNDIDLPFQDQGQNFAWLCRFEDPLVSGPGKDFSQQGQIGGFIINDQHAGVLEKRSHGLRPESSNSSAK